MATDPAGTRSTTTYNVLFVCTGNTCRSPMAEALAREEIGRRGWKHVRVRSAGIAAAPGSPATPEAISVVARRGLDLSGHRSAQLSEELVDWADVILAMGHSHLHAVRALGGEHKMALLGEFGAAEAADGRPVPDPFGGDEATYAATLDALSVLVADALDRIAPVVEP